MTNQTCKTCHKTKYSAVIAAILVAGVLACSLAFGSVRFLTGVFFGVNTSPIEMPIKASFEDRQTDAKTTAIVAATDRFLASLDEDQLATVMFDFDDNTQRSNWSNFPEGMIPRGGLMMGKMSDHQLQLLDELMNEILSEKGMLNIDYQLVAEDTHEKSAILKYGTEYFYVAILGEPSMTQPWMFMYGGHHLAINVTVYGSETTFSPMLTGGQPLNIDYKGEKIFITEEETQAGQHLLDALTNQQKQVAVLSDQPIDLLLGPGEYGTVVAPEGIKGSELTAAQKELLIDLIDTRMGFINADDYAAAMEVIMANLDDTYFGWWGPQNGPLGFAYFRVTGPTMILEYSPQNDAGETVTEHAHSIFRDPTNDYGVAWIGK